MAYFPTYHKNYTVNEKLYKILVELPEHFDWRLFFIKSVSESFLFDYQLIFKNPEVITNDDFTSKIQIPEIRITGKIGNESLTKTIIEFLSFKIFRLNEIYLVGHTNLNALVLKNQDETSKIKLKLEIVVLKYKPCKNRNLSHKITYIQRNQRNGIVKGFTNMSGKLTEN